MAALFVTGCVTPQPLPLPNVRNHALDDEHTVLSRAREGCADALASIVRQHQDVIRRYVRRFLSQVEIADDVAQSVFLSAFENLAGFRGESSLRSWLLTIARNAINEHYRERVRRHQKEGELLAVKLAEWRSSLAHDSTSEADDQATLDALRDCLTFLSDHHRDVVEQHYFLRRSAESIATSAGKNGSAIRMMLMRVRGILRECIERKRGSDS